MARSSAAAARRAHSGHVAPPARPRPRPAPARRKSGPAAKPRTAARPRAAAPPRTLAATLGRLAEARLLDRLLRGRLWVGCVGALLAGIVFLNVSLLQLNQDIAHTGKQSTALDRQNSTLRMRLAALDSTERIQRLAAARGMVMPAPGQYRYVTPHPSRDGALAARRISAPQPSTLAAAPAPAVAQTTPVTASAAPVAAAPGTTTTPTTATTTATTPVAQATPTAPTTAAAPTGAATAHP